MEVAAARRPRVLTEIDPHSEWVHGRDFDVLVVDVTGFSKEHLKVQVEPSGSLKISGERAVVDGGGGGGRHSQWFHFTKRFDLPRLPVDDDDAAAAATITVHLDKGMLYIQVPRPPAGGGAAASSWGTEQRPDGPAAEVYEDALLRGEDEISDDGHGHGGGGGGGGWNIGRRVVAAPHPLRRLAMGFSRHRQVILNVVLAVVLFWLVAFAKNKPGAGKND